MKKIGVIGAGVMGKGVAQAFSQSGYPVVLIDICDKTLMQASEEIYNNVRLQGLFQRSETVADPDAVLSRIQLSMDYELLADVEYVVENVTEKWETKREVYQKLDSVCLKDCVTLVNTSCISITKIAALTKRPALIAGAHFMNPVPMKPAVELIRGYHTAESTIEQIKDLLLSIGKETIVVNDYPGFVSNRISHLFMNEAAFVVQDQVASPQEVDEIFKRCYSHAMGPLETADLIGLDTVVQSLDVLYESYQDSKFRCCPLLRKMVEAGLCGRKSGQGFYTYE
ncbi:3-hydroxyacyl-CoA dehydrogenase family protein [Paenibacillus thiaminolyticus]|uniref:3-hydroxybutyryl-CoA dehydrogenase n=1 Tax=Paenibacillus thiaminolyticus TaxID=49283 RepID=A0A3A3GLF7_PANTH|nr:3-hydroxyacyl-CoA dehydrogenase NAD-binding domain-containing protein [Paenibacillus thiaminolyticus]RJG25979.1 3-hydroxybutyryl-CoA dehydrogenase [Paenibacillus thiaminolyticus]